jgi:hypothetical protein
MFKKGQSGNPAGPAKGTRHKITMLAEKAYGDRAKAFVAALQAELAEAARCQAVMAAIIGGAGLRY